MFWDTFLSVLGVIGIVAVAAFVIVFLSDLFITIVDGTNGIFFKRQKKSDQRPSYATKKPRLLSKPVENLMAPKQEEQLEAEEEDDEEQLEVDFDKAEQEELAARQLLAQRRSNLMAAENTIIPTEDEEEDEEDEEDEDEFDFEEEETEEDKAISSITKELKDAIIEDNNIALSEQLDADNEQLKKEIAELKSQIEQANVTIEELKKQSTAGDEVKAGGRSKEDMEQYLETLRLRLKENEKELSANRKEFVPLRRVNKTLDSDKKKLRRKEAIVAKQKVMLYGVNNYVDIDEEKAKKLSEELDLLEGLRLSVQHCEEVMQKNVDRYPILERVNTFLTKNQKDLKADIASLEEQLKNLEDAEESEKDE